MANKLHLENQIFGKLLVIREADLEERKNPSIRSWICQCECGNLTQVDTAHLTSGHTKSCGCYKNSGVYNQNRRQDFTGAKFGRFTILRDAESKNGKRYVECQCDCGTVKIIRLSDLKAGKVQSCGCLRNERVKEAMGKLDHSKPTYRNDLSGQKFGYLTVLGFDPDTTLQKRTENNSKSYWKCICVCGTKLSVVGTQLTSGHTQSCGCLQKEQAMKNIEIARKAGTQQSTAKLEGMRFDKLTVLELDDVQSGQGNGSFWRCRCDCGTIKTVPYSSLVQGHSHSCGCLKMSTGEYRISQILSSKDVDYKQEVKFQDLKDKTSLRFDFGIYQDGELILLIEYDGRQHFDSSSQWYNETVVLHDQMKTEYCQQHNIPLLRIPYTMSQEEILNTLTNANIF